MEDLYRLDDPTASSHSDYLLRVGEFSLGNYAASEFNSPFVDSMLQFSNEMTTGSDISGDLIVKAQIKNHPGYPNLVSAYIDCQKVGANPEMASLLEEIKLDNNTTRSYCEIGADPELDEFMESYCEVLHRCKEELSKQFDEAVSFLNSTQSQLSNLCKGGELMRNLDYPSVEAAGNSEELSYGEIESLDCHDSLNTSGAGPADDQDVKEMLMRKYSGCLGSLKKEFLKKRKGKLPKDAKKTLMDWWNEHYRWPYPREDDKLKLSEETGLDQKQINNWFVNQRKRHWKPSEL